MPKKIFQVTQSDIDRSCGKLRWYDLHKWCFVYESNFYGFCETKEEAIEKAQNFDPKKDAILKMQF